MPKSTWYSYIEQLLNKNYCITTTIKVCIRKSIPTDTETEHPLDCELQWILQSSPFFPSHGIQSHDRTHYTAITLCHKLFTFNRSVFHKQESIPFIIKPYFIDFKIYYLDSKLEMTITCTRSTNWSFRT